MTRRVTSINGADVAQTPFSRDSRRSPASAALVVPPSDVRRSALDAALCETYTVRRVCTALRSLVTQLVLLMAAFALTFGALMLVTSPRS